MKNIKEVKEELLENLNQVLKIYPTPNHPKCENPILDFPSDISNLADSELTKLWNECVNFQTYESAMQGRLLAELKVWETIRDYVFSYYQIEVLDNKQKFSSRELRDAYCKTTNDYVEANNRVVNLTSMQLMTEGNLKAYTDRSFLCSRELTKRLSSHESRNNKFN